MAGSILNYTTKIEAARTAAEIIGIIAKVGAKRSNITYDGAGVPLALEFMVTTETGEMVFRLPSRSEGVYQVLYDDWNRGKISGTFASRQQATRVAWRILKDWVEAQAAIIQVGMVQLHEVMLPYHVLPEGNGVTMFEAFVDQRKALPPGGQQ